MVDERSERVRMYRSKAVRCTLSSVDRAVAGEPLEGHERLAVLQNLLVDLLSYLEKKEGFRTSYGERRRAAVETVYADEVFLHSQCVRILHQMPGRVRLGIPRLRADKTCASDLQLLLESLNRVKRVRVNADAACVVVEYSADVTQSEFMPAVVRRLEEELSGLSSNGDVLLSRQFIADRI